MYSRNTEIRHIAAADAYQLAQILEHSNSWKKLMAIIPKTFSSPPVRDAPKKYNADEIRLIENASLKQGRTGAEILFDEWGTSGRKRPTVGNLLDLLVEAELLRAADYVAMNFLNEPPPERPANGPAAKIDISLPFETEEIKDVDEIMEDISYPGTSVLMKNANDPSSMINHDFYTKISPDKGKVEVSASDLIKFSMSTVDSGELPILSAIGKSSSDIPDLMQLNSRLNNTQSSATTNPEANIFVNNDDNEVTDSCNIPVLSALQMHSTNSVNTTEENSTELPDLSALNLQVSPNRPTTPNDTPMTTTTATTPNGVSESEDREHHLNVPNAANGLYDSDNNLTPDLSILDQSSLDDSSLTNVTETSEELSFDAQTRLNLSENNLPMLSILQKWHDKKFSVSF